MGISAGEITKIKIGSSALTGIVSVDGPEISVGKVDTSTIGAAGAKTSRPSRKYEVGPINLEILWDSKDTVHDSLYDNSLTGTTFTYEEEYEDGAKFSGTVFVASIGFSGSEDEGNITASVVLEHTGGTTYTPAAGGE